MLKRRIFQVGKIMIGFIITFIFLYSGWKVIESKKETRECLATYQELSNFVHKNSEESGNSKKETLDKEGTCDLDDNNFQELKKENEDFIGWIEIDETSIDYPVMQRNNSFYLSHGFHKEKSKYGVPFLDERSVLKESNLLIYGHHMKDGTMFGGLEKYKNAEFCEKHKVVKWQTQNQKEEFEIFGVCEADADINNALFQKILDDKNVISQKWLKDNCIYLYYFDDKAYHLKNKIIVLITCEYTTINGRLLIIASKK